MSGRKGRRATPKVRRPREELETALRRRHRFLTASARAYDAGDTDEAFRMSVDLRALLHYGSSPPLLHELGLIKKLAFVDSRPEIPGVSGGTVAVWGGGLTVMRFETKADGAAEGTVVPRCDADPDGDVGDRSRYTPWWKSNRVVTSEDGKRYSRAFVVTQMANSDAAHTDSYLDGDYQALRPREAGWEVSGPDGVSRPVISDVAAASIRQITWEVVRTLEEQCADLLG